jgi:DNA-directed RNA polymerase specialized sigma24 family protein
MNSDRSAAKISGAFWRALKGDRQAFGDLYNDLKPKLLPFIRSRLRSKPVLHPYYNEDDAFDSGMSLMWARIIADQTAPLASVDDFLRLARTIIARRIKDRLREATAEKRNPSPRPDADHNAGSFETFVPDDLDLFACGLPSGDVQVISEDERQWLMSILGPELRQIAEYRVNGATVKRIAGLLGKPLRTVERMFEEIRAIWTQARKDR